MKVPLAGPQDVASATPYRPGSPQSFGAETFARNIGIGGEQLGRAAGLAADYQLKQQNQDDTREAKELDVQFSQRVREITFGDGTDTNPGYYNQRGTAAIAQYGDTMSGIAKVREDMLAGIQNPRVKEMFGLSSAGSAENEYATIDRHAAGERHTANVNASLSRAEQAQSDAALRYNDPKAFANSLTILNGEAASQKDLNGWSDDETNNWLSKAKSDTAMAVIAAASNQHNLPMANQLYGQYKDLLTATDGYKVQNELDNAASYERTQRLQQQALEKQQLEAAQQANAASLVSDFIGNKPIDMTQVSIDVKANKIDPSFAITLNNMVKANAKEQRGPYDEYMSEIALHGGNFDLSKAANDPTINGQELASITQYQRGFKSDVPEGTSDAYSKMADRFINKNYPTPAELTDPNSGLSPKEREHFNTLLQADPTGNPVYAQAMTDVLSGKITTTADVLKIPNLSGPQYSALSTEIEQRDTRAKTDTRNAAYKDWYSKITAGDPSVTELGIANDPRLGAGDAQALNAQLKAAQNKPPLEQISAATLPGLMSRIRLPWGDPNKILSEQPLYDAFSAGNLSKADLDRGLKEFQDMKTPQGQTLGAAKEVVLKSVHGTISKPGMAGFTDPVGEQNYGYYTQYVDALIAEKVANNQSPYTLLNPDPSNKEYVGAPSVLMMFQRSPEESMNYMLKRLQQAPSNLPSMPGSPAAAPAPVDATQYKDLGSLQTDFNAGKISAAAAKTIAKQNGWAQ